MSNEESKQGKVKKPVSAYFLYMNDVRHKVKEKNPDLAYKEIVKKIGEMWNTLPAKEKELYIAQQKANKEAYDTENAGTKKEKKPVKPKKNCRRQASSEKKG